jgi:hypothetical protein
VDKKKFDLKQALYNSLVRVTPGNKDERVVIFLGIVKNTGISVEELDKLLTGRLKDGSNSVVQVYYSILGYMQSHKMDTSHIL